MTDAPSGQEPNQPIRPEPATRPGPVTRPEPQDQAPPEISPVARFVGTRLWTAGFFMALAGLVVLALVARSAYLYFHHGHAKAALAPLFAGGTLGLALLSVGASIRRNGQRWLNGDVTAGGILARVLGRYVARRLSRERRFL